MRPCTTITEDIRQFITTEGFPLHKLDWHVDMKAAYWTEVFRLLDAAGHPVRKDRASQLASGG